MRSTSCPHCSAAHKVQKLVNYVRRKTWRAVPFSSGLTFASLLLAGDEDEDQVEHVRSASAVQGYVG